MGTRGKPTHVVVLTEKENKKNKSYVGVAWVMPFGGYHIILNPGTVLDWRMNEEFFIGLVEKDQREKRQEEKASRQENHEAGPPEKDDVPF